MKTKLIIGIATALAIALIIGESVVWNISAEKGEDEKIANNDKIKYKKLPKSLDQYYDGEKPFEYLIEMYKLGESMMGIPVNLGQGDYANAARSFENFSQNYVESSQMVPKWKKYYDLKAVEKLGHALDAGDPAAISEAMDKVGETCSDCHLDAMTPVYYEYYWGDFADVNIQTPDGPLPWQQAKMFYLLVGFDGIGVNINEGDQTGAQQSFELFNSTFQNMTVACLECHSFEPRYYVSEDVQSMINEMGEKIDAGDSANLTEANYLRYSIGDECHNCHIIHIPPQYT